MPGPCWTTCPEEGNLSIVQDPGYPHFPDNCLAARVAAWVEELATMVWGLCLIYPVTDSPAEWASRRHVVRPLMPYAGEACPSAPVRPEVRAFIPVGEPGAPTLGSNPEGRDADVDPMRTRSAPFATTRARPDEPRGGQMGEGNLETLMAEPVGTPARPDASSSGGHAIPGSGTVNVQADVHMEVDDSVHINFPDATSYESVD